MHEKEKKHTIRDKISEMKEKLENYDYQGEVIRDLIILEDAFEELGLSIKKKRKEMEKEGLKDTIARDSDRIKKEARNILNEIVVDLEVSLDRLKKNLN